MDKGELNRVKGEIEALLPTLGKHRIEELQRTIAKHYVRRFKGKRKIPKYGALNKGFTDLKLTAFFHAIDNPKHRLLFSYMAYLGLRVGEVCFVNIKDMDFKTRELKVRSEKTHKLDLLVIPLSLWQQTQQFINANRLAIDESDGYFFYQEKGKSKRQEHYIEPNYVRKVFRQYIISCGLDEVYDVSDESMEGRGTRRLHILTTHSLRHYAISKFARATNGNLILTSRFARHLEPSTTTTYIHTDKEELYRAIDGAFS